MKSNSLALTKARLPLPAQAPLLLDFDCWYAVNMGGTTIMTTKAKQIRRSNMMQSPSRIVGWTDADSKNITPFFERQVTNRD